MRTRLTWVIAILLAAGLGLAGVSTPASAQGFFGISAGLYQPQGEADRTEVYGLRGAWRFHPSFGVEASLSRVDLSDSIAFDFASPLPETFDVHARIDLDYCDLSLQWFPGGGSFVVFGGPGVARLDSDVSASYLGLRFSASDTRNIVTAHAGLAYQWQAGARFFVRPEARVRRYFDDEPKEPEAGDQLTVFHRATDLEAGVTVGWRIGSRK